MAAETRVLKEFRAGDKISQAVLLRLQKFGTAVNGKKYARGTVQDNSATLNFICFNEVIAEEIRGLANPGIILVSGAISPDKFGNDGSLQVVIEEIKHPGTGVDLSNLLPYAPKDIALYRGYLQECIDSIGNTYLRQLVATVLSGDVYEHFVINPAASRYHHAYIGGLLEHSVDVAQLARAMAKEAGGIDCDMVMAGALLHDVGKIYEISPDIGFTYTAAGHLIGHLALGALVVNRAIDKIVDFPAELASQLLHVLLSHHGALDKGSPIACATKESFVVHYADELNAVFNQFNQEECNGSEWQYSKMLNRQILQKH